MFSLGSGLLSLLNLGLLVLVAWALVDAATRPGAAIDSTGLKTNH
jgi:hypothetical protein